MKDHEEIWTEGLVSLRTLTQCTLNGDSQEYTKVSVTNAMLDKCEGRQHMYLGEIPWNGKLAHTIIQMDMIGLYPIFNDARTFVIKNVESLSIPDADAPISTNINLVTDITVIPSARLIMRCIGNMITESRGTVIPIKFITETVGDTTFVSKIVMADLMSHCRTGDRFFINAISNSRCTMRGSNMILVDPLIDVEQMLSGDMWVTTPESYCGDMIMNEVEFPAEIHQLIAHKMYYMLTAFDSRRNFAHIEHRSMSRFLQAKLVDYHDVRLESLIMERLMSEGDEEPVFRLRYAPLSKRMDNLYSRCELIQGTGAPIQFLEILWKLLNDDGSDEDV